MSDIEKDFKLVLRLPPMLARRMDASVNARKTGIRKYSRNDWIVEAIREKLDGREALPMPQGGRNVPVTDLIQSWPPQRKSAAEIAAAIPGVSLGVGGVPAARPDGLWDDPGEDVQARPWLPELIALTRRGEFEDVTDDFRTLYGGDFRPPKGWANWGVEKRAAWLDENHPLEVK